MTLRLHYAPDNASLCVRLALEALDRPFETLLVDRRTNSQRTPEYLALNPNGRIPTLETPQGVMFETAAILLWLADQEPGRLFPAPSDPARGAALTWLFWLSNTLHPCLRRIFYGATYGPAKQVRDIAKIEVQDLWAIAEERMDHLHLPMIRCYLIPMLRWTNLYCGHPGWIDLGAYPNLQSAAKAFEQETFVTRAARSEGLGPTPFSNPSLPNPPEGSAL